MYIYTHISLSLSLVIMLYAIILYRMICLLYPIRRSRGTSRPARTSTSERAGGRFQTPGGCRW